ncbi:MAG: DUF1501 domain-containing protein [Crocinitomicaceae bacterium]|nr:DUF1501 domain-containing protein [Crocinitomicaceae bacterium]MDG1657489.1 DUF1501 domain-containing protein [Crocinitomicaceae bacterium]|tara:strand:+ start:6985 stop:8178 length:1194 start_codon:yes stop_codon:yes gene_type:complete
MDRRNFIKTSALASGMVFVPSFLKKLEFLPEDKLSGFKNVIIIQLSGGNDGLNTVIPYSNDIYHRLRPKIGKDASKVLKLNDSLGLNGSCTELMKLYENGELCIINNVGYPNPNRSHFRSTDIWQTASASNEYLGTGWLGRYQDANCQYPYEAIEYDNSLSLAMKGRIKNGIAVTDPNQLFQTTREKYFKSVVDHTDESMLNEDNQGYLYKTMLETYSSAEYIYERSKIYNSTSEYPNTKFAMNLKGIADMVVSGLKTRVYYTSLSGFDTHINQVNSQDRLLKTYSDGIGALVEDLKKNDRFKDTLIMTFSEFGRRASENSSAGTDHGSANNVFMIGGGLKNAGIYNNGPDLVNLDKNGDLKFQVDFRSIYATVLDNWLGVNDQRILNKSFSKLNFI